MKILQALGGRDYLIREVPRPEPGAGELRIRVQAVTICTQWDLHLRSGHPMFPGHRFEFPYPPGQPGHEAAGTVDAVGEGVDEFRVGDRVSLWRDPGHHVSGAYAQYVVRDAADAIRVPSWLEPWQTAAVELAMCVGACFLVLKRLDAVRGAVFGVSGLGAAGLIAGQMALAEGAREVVGLDPYLPRRLGALAVGFSSVVDPATDALPRRPNAHLNAAIDCVGSKRSVEHLMDLTSGPLALFGVQREAYDFRPDHYLGLHLCGYPGHSRAAAEYAVGLIERGTLDLGKLVSHHLPLESYAEAVDLLEVQNALKVCLYPWGVPATFAAKSKVLPAVR